MKIYGSTFIITPWQNKPSNKAIYANLSPLPRDIVSFGARSTSDNKSITPEESYNHLYNLCFKNHRNFFEGAGPRDGVEYLDYFFNRYEDSIESLSELCDKELNSILQDKGIGNLIEYLKIIHSLKKTKTFDLLKDAINCTNPDGSKLRQNQKLELVDLLNVYKTTHQTPTELRRMVEEGKVDITALKRNIISDILKQVGNYERSAFSKIPQDKLDMWDIGYTYLLAISNAKTRGAFEDVVKLANTSKDFKTVIHSDNNTYGKINNETKKIFESHGMNYDNWLSPPAETNVKLNIRGNDVSGLNEIADSLNDTIEILRSRPAVKKIIDKKYKSFVTDKEMFILPFEVSSNKAAFLKFLIRFDSDMAPVWRRAEKNLDSPDETYRSYAKVTMKMQQHITEYLKQVQAFEPNKNLDLTIKMWDRIPQKDLFQGNYSTCCIGIGKAYGEYMPSYLLNSAFNMVEIVDDASGKTIGNSLCYYLLNEDDKPVLVFDNVEINNSFGSNLSHSMQKQIRAALAQYGQNLNKQILNAGAPVYVGDSHNDIPILDLEPETLNDVHLLGDMDKCDYVYADVFGGSVSKEFINDYADLRVLKNE
ncbi:MAG: hypothetical protein NC191_03440 [Muribaculaceae bacterium]|nr:hypothetical protein [Muribaculaceae bacterium]